MKKKKIIYWVATLWLALGMASTGFVQLIKLPEEVEKLADGLGYPEYILPVEQFFRICQRETSQ